MRICLYLDPSRLLRWHQWLAEALAGAPGNEVSCAFAVTRRPLPSTCRLLIDLERLVYGFGTNGAIDPAETALRSLPTHPDGDVDVVINFSGEEPLTAAGRMLTPLFNGVPGEIGVMTALTNDQDLRVDLHDTASASGSWTAQPASSDRGVLAAGLDSALSCAVALILKVLREEAGAAASGVREARTTTPSLGALQALAFATGALSSKAIRFLDMLARGGKTWAIGWRFDEVTSLLDGGDAAFRVLSGDANNYLADPFPFQHKGRDFIFVEKYLSTKSRGCIAVVTADRNGTATAPQIVLEEPHHLSYPVVFEQNGQIWMIPESGAAGNVSLYRAVEFPHRWTREACLVEGVEYYDTTPLEHAGAFWFFVSPRVLRSTSWDVLSIYRAESLTGAWTPHAENPVLIDARLSRPAGAFIRQGGRTLRPAQDCSRRYGGGVTFCQIDALDRSTFVQTPVGRIRSGAFGCHTYNRQSGLEVVDLFGHVRDVRDVTISYGPHVSRPSATYGQAPAPADTDLATL